MKIGYAHVSPDDQNLDLQPPLPSTVRRSRTCT
ncbi:hypothetical protein SAMN05216332_11616 [Nitrosospira briensis]|nr:hypothetical protein SAMN05216332_11616 [Nitrosospira briensis]